MWIDFNDSFTVVTVVFLHTNVELNLPHHSNYVATLPCKKSVILQTKKGEVFLTHSVQMTNLSSSHNDTATAIE